MFLAVALRAAQRAFCFCLLCRATRQIVSGSNWNDIMHYFAHITNRGAIVFFISLLVIGKFVLLNLFLAVLLDSFSAEGDSEEVDDAGTTNPDTTVMSPMPDRVHSGTVTSPMPDRVHSATVTLHSGLVAVNVPQVPDTAPSRMSSGGGVVARVRAHPPQTHVYTRHSSG